MNATSQIATAHDITQAVRDTAILADISVSTWSGERSDRKVMDKVAAEAGATGEVGRVIKNLMAGADTRLKEARSAFVAFRSAHYELTLPWVSDPHAARQGGPRLLPNALFDRYMTAMAARKRTADMARDVMLDAYPADIVVAQQTLGGLAKADDYPPVDEIRRAFRVSFDFEPVPSAGGFKGLPQGTLDKLSARLEAKQSAMVAAANEHSWGQVRERVEHLLERLATPDKTVHESTAMAVIELPGLLSGWNITEDPRLAEIASDLTDMVDGLTIKALRKDAAVRANIVEQASAVSNKLASWGL
jgi:hypothetical protein